MVKLSPKSEALAFRVWSYCRDIEWRISISELAEVLGEHPSRLTLLATRKGWLDRFSTVAQDRMKFADNGANLHSFDHSLDGGSYAHIFHDIKAAAGIRPEASE